MSCLGRKLNLSSRRSRPFRDGAGTHLYSSFRNQTQITRYKTQTHRISLRIYLSGIISEVYNTFEARGGGLYDREADGNGPPFVNRSTWLS